jgi:signal transduction histidine kinase
MWIRARDPARCPRPAKNPSVLATTVRAEPNGADPLSVRANKLDLLERVADDLAHEIKNPLHSMVINLEILKRRIARAEVAGSDEMMRYVEVLGSEIDRVSQRLDLLLRMVRPGKPSDSTPLQEVLDELGELLLVEAGRRNVRLEISQRASARVSVPRELARQLVLNMVLLVLDHLTTGQALVLDVVNDGTSLQVSVTGALRDPVDPPGETAPPETAPDTTARTHRSDVLRTLSHQLGGWMEFEGTGAGAQLTLVLPVAR